MYLIVPIWQQEGYVREPLSEGHFAEGNGHEGTGEESDAHAANGRNGQPREEHELQQVIPKGKTFAEENVDEQSERH